MRVLVADDSAIIFEHLAEILASDPDIEMVGHATNISGTLRSLAGTHPDVVILDLHMPGGTGIDVLEWIKRNKLETAAVVLSNFPYPQYRARCAELRAVAFLDKSMQFDKVLEVLHELGDNHKVLVES
jgi:DNA-binding NarL/FixJ family response regulator